MPTTTSPGAPVAQAEDLQIRTPMSAQDMIRFARQSTAVAGILA